jgi:hypothetical protein
MLIMMKNITLELKKSWLNDLNPGESFGCPGLPIEQPVNIDCPGLPIEQPINIDCPGRPIEQPINIDCPGIPLEYTGILGCPGRPINIEGIISLITDTDLFSICTWIAIMTGIILTLGCTIIGTIGIITRFDTRGQNQGGPSQGPYYGGPSQGPYYGGPSQGPYYGGPSQGPHYGGPSEGPHYGGPSRPYQSPYPGPWQNQAGPYQGPSRGLRPDRQWPTRYHPSQDPNRVVTIGPSFANILWDPWTNIHTDTRSYPGGKYLAEDGKWYHVGTCIPYNGHRYPGRTLGDDGQWYFFRDGQWWQHGIRDVSQKVYPPIGDNSQPWIPSKLDAPAWSIPKRKSLPTPMHPSTGPMGPPKTFKEYLQRPR